MSDYSIEDHIAYNMGFKAGQEAQAARIAELEAALQHIIKALEDPTGGQHVFDMRFASSVASAALEGKGNA
jgi:hypothetical protein